MPRFKRSRALPTPLQTSLPAQPAMSWQGMGLRAVGTAAGSYLGNPALGYQAGAGLSRIFGYGDYTVANNSLWDGGAPVVANGPRYVDISHREYLFDVYAGSGTPTAFTSQTIAINPGLIQSFPWLSAIAGQFNEWEPLGILVGFESTSSGYAANTALGRVIIASEYNANSVQPNVSAFAGQPYSSPQEMENSEFCTTGSIDKNLLHPIECALGERPVKILSTRTANAASLVTGTTSSDLRFTDLCNVQIATVGCPTPGAILGKLIITYTIRLWKPQLNVGLLGRSIISQIWTCPTGVTITLPMGTAPTSATNNTIQTKFLTQAADPVGWQDKFVLHQTGASNVTKVFLPSWMVNGTYMVMVYADGNATILDYAMAVNPAATCTLTAQSSFYGFGANASQIYAGASVSTTSLIRCFMIFVNGPPSVLNVNYFTITPSAIFSGTPRMQIMLHQVNDFIETPTGGN